MTAGAAASPPSAAGSFSSSRASTPNSLSPLSPRSHFDRLAPPRLLAAAVGGSDGDSDSDAGSGGLEAEAVDDLEDGYSRPAEEKCALYKER